MHLFYNRTTQNVAHCFESQDLIFIWSWDVDTLEIQPLLHSPPSSKMGKASYGYTTILSNSMIVLSKIGLRSESLLFQSSLSLLRSCNYADMTGLIKVSDIHGAPWGLQKMGTRMWHHRLLESLVLYCNWCAGLQARDKVLHFLRLRVVPFVELRGQWLGMGPATNSWR